MRLFGRHCVVGVADKIPLDAHTQDIHTDIHTNRNTDIHTNIHTSIKHTY